MGQQGAESSAVEDGDDEEDAADSDKSPECGMAPAVPALPPRTDSPKPTKKITEVNISTEDAAESDKSPESGIAHTVPAKQACVYSPQHKMEIKQAAMSAEADLPTKEVQKVKDMQNRASSIPCNGERNQYRQQGGPSGTRA